MMEGLMRAGWPNRTVRKDFCLEDALPRDWSSSPVKRSRMLSTATLLGAVTSTRMPCRWTAWRISSATVVVFPVPGGPWIRATLRSGCSAKAMASRWLASSPGLKHGLAGEDGLDCGCGCECDRDPGAENRARTTDPAIGWSSPWRSKRSRAATSFLWTSIELFGTRVRGAESKRLISSSSSPAAPLLAFFLALEFFGLPLLACAEECFASLKIIATETDVSETALTTPPRVPFWLRLPLPLLPLPLALVRISTSLPTANRCAGSSGRPSEDVRGMGSFAVPPVSEEVQRVRRTTVLP
mmetsp:Transcript_6944/g.20116  ORF Transcript_6944/g.20116 Transcript_6944/m.20116 type:complete len:298 (+) Transcript_6944:2534-3427(+)